MDIVNKQHSFKELEMKGYQASNYCWAPEWIGDANIPSCYKLTSWNEREKIYDFSKTDGPWDYRYGYLISMIDDNCISVMDMGAGNMSLKKMLDMKIRYYPVDNVSRCSETIVCDFNKSEFPQLNVYTIVCAGILEYILPDKIEFL